MTESTRLLAGAMSGTSADGVDVAITRVDGRGLGMGAQLIRHHHRPYDAGLRQRIFALRGWGLISLADLARLARDISLAYSVSGPYDVHATLDLLNVTDSSAYDVLGVQKPGRAAFFKLTTCWACSR